MSWLLLIGAGILEMLCVTMMNQFQKDRHVKWILFIAAGFSLSFLMLSLAMNTIPMGTAYAIWTGIEPLEEPLSACCFTVSRRTQNVYSLSH